MVARYTATLVYTVKPLICIEAIASMFLKKVLIKVNADLFLLDRW